MHKALIRTTDNGCSGACYWTFPQNDSDRELWIVFGCGKSFRYIAAHDIANSLGQGKTRALLVFHAFTGCDTVSFFRWEGKKTAWNTWNAFPETTSTLDRQVTEGTFTTLQEFVLMYDRSSTLANVNAARQVLFARISKALENIPPTEAALKQQYLRAVYQSGNVWAQNLDKDLHLPSPSSWGWERLYHLVYLFHFILMTLASWVRITLWDMSAGVTERSDFRRILTPGSFFYVEM
jgi:hypothetical protein